MIALSVVIPVYKTAATLGRCLESLCPLPDGCEVILIDDGSPDEAPQLCDQWAQRFPQIRVAHQANQGLSAARNTGIRMSRGRRITFIDSDDTLAPGTLPSLMLIADSHPEYDIIEYPMEIGYPSDGQHRLALTDTVYTDWRSYWHATRAYTHCYACNKLFGRHLFDHCLFDIGKTFEDAHIYPRLLQQAHVIATTATGCYRYYANPAGITMRATGADLESLLEAHCRTLRLVSSSDYYAHVVNIALDVYHATGRIPQIPRLPYHGTPKLLVNYLLGFSTLCRIHRLIRRRH